MLASLHPHAMRLYAHRGDGQAWTEGLSATRQRELEEQMAQQLGEQMRKGRRK